MRLKVDVMLHACNPRTQEAETGGSQAGLKINKQTNK
jgi:hypothetical protein